MKTLFYLLSFLVILVGAYFSYESKNKLIAEQELTADTLDLKNVVIGNNKKQEEIRDARLDDVARTERDIADTEASIESAISKEKTSKSSLASLNIQLKNIESELAKYEELQLKVEEALDGEGITGVEEIPGKIDELKIEINEKTGQKESLELVIEELENKVAIETEDKNNTVSRLTSIQARVAKNDMVAAVTSVNTEWGFVIVNAGSSNSTIESNTNLVVQRDGRFIGSLKAAAVSPNQTICDLDIEGSAGSIRPGDTVILKTPVVK